jgi:hypothetical protein
LWKKRVEVTRVVRVIFHSASLKSLIQDSDRSGEDRRAYSGSSGVTLFIREMQTPDTPSFIGFIVSILYPLIVFVGEKKKEKCVVSVTRVTVVLRGK